MKPNTPQISEAEWEVMKALWEGGEPTAGEVARRVAQWKDWHPRTVKTLLSRLVRKGAAEMKEATGGRFVYRAKATREACRRDESRSFLARVFDGQVGPAVVQFVQEAKLSRREIEELKRILDAGK